MPHKKLPVHSKLIAVIVGFIATLYLLFVGFSYLKAQNDFKPYHNLAVELNEQLGGGYTITETKRCNIEGPVCPNAELLRIFNNIGDADSAYSKLTDVLGTAGFKNPVIHDCKVVSGVEYCTSEASTTGNLIIGVVKADKRISITITKTE